MHGAAHWVAFNMWSLGGTIVVQSEVKRLDPHDIWSTVERERVTALTIVGDAFGRPLLDQLAKRDYDLSSLRLLTSGGAILTAALKQEFLKRLPGIRLLDALGSSESGSQASQSSRAGGRTTTGDFEMAPDNTVLREDLKGPVTPGSGEVGWLARRGRVPLGYLGDPEKTARTFPVIDGTRYAVPGDRARLEADGRLALLGRDSVTINTGGEKVFAEEVEQALKAHGDVWDCLVVGAPHPRFGQQVVGLVAARAGAEALARGDADALAAVAAEAARHLAAYKRPRHLWVVPAIQRSPSGKPDYGWGRALAAERIGAPGSEDA